MAVASNFLKYLIGYYLINKKKCLAVIPARGGSKRLKRKNVKLFNGKPLIAWSIIEAKKSQYIDKIIVSTEDQEIAEVALSYGASVPYLRPISLSDDSVGATEPVLELLSNIGGYKQVVLLQPTSPLRLSKDIDACIKVSEDHEGTACVSICSLVHDPAVLFMKDKSNKISSYKQDYSSTICRINGAVYTSSSIFLQKHNTFITNNILSYEMPINRSIDIDTIEEFSLAENLMKLKSKNSV